MLLGTMEAVSVAFTRPGARNAWVVFCGWVLTMGTHAVTQALVVTDVARRVHHERFHRFFSRGAWKPDTLGRLLFERLERECGIGPMDVEVTIFETPRHNWGIRGAPGDELDLSYRVEV